MSCAVLTSCESKFKEVLERVIEETRLQSQRQSPAPADAEGSGDDDAAADGDDEEMVLWD